MDQDRNKAWGFSLFCDDIRPEIGGKVSAMGLYGDEFIFQGQLPFVVPKFVVVIFYYELASSIDTDVSFRVHFPWDESQEKPQIELQIPRSDLRTPDTASLDRNADPNALIHVRVPITFSPLLIQKEGRIAVRANYADQTVLRLGTLKIRAARPDEGSMFLSAPANPQSLDDAV